VPLPPKATFAENDFIEFHDVFILYYDEILKGALRSSETFFVINYEELNNMVLLANLINSIGADANKPIQGEEQRRERAKQNSSDIVGRFSNRAEVEAFLRKRGLEHWQHEGEVSLAPFGAQSIAEALPQVRMSRLPGYHPLTHRKNLLQLYVGGSVVLRGQF
jgi:hypothetical protein